MHTSQPGHRRPANDNIGSGHPPRSKAGANRTCGDWKAPDEEMRGFGWRDNDVIECVNGFVTDQGHVVYSNVGFYTPAAVDRFAERLGPPECDVRTKGSTIFRRQGPAETDMNPHWAAIKTMTRRLACGHPAACLSRRPSNTPPLRPLLKHVLRGRCGPWERGSAIQARRSCGLTENPVKLP
jgi:hypothetical protein